MKKQLLVITLAVAFSSTAFAEEVPAVNHAEIAQNLIQKLETKVGQNCPMANNELPKIKAIFDKLSNDSATDEDKVYLEQLKTGYDQSHHKPTIEDLTGKTTETPEINLSEETSGTQEKNAE